MNSVSLGLSGDMGSFSEEAALLYAKQQNIQSALVYLIDMENVLAAIERQEIELGIFPVINLIGGLVKPAFLAMGRHLFTPIDELWLPIQQCLLVLPDKEAKDIRKLVSHPQGLAQCQGYLDKEFKHIPQQEWSDTAKAARDLAQGNLSPSTAVIAPARCADLYGLKVLAFGIQDRNPNLTAFIIVKTKEACDDH